MIEPAQQFRYAARDSNLGCASLAPMLPLTLIGEQSIATVALLDTGAAVNVLPYSLGKLLGFEWEKCIRSVELTGNLASIDSRVVMVSAVVGKFSAVRLAFAWAETDSISAILGQVNFFLEFDVCFFRSRTVFEIRPKTTM